MVNSPFLRNRIAACARAQCLLAISVLKSFFFSLCLCRALPTTSLLHTNASIYKNNNNNHRNGRTRTNDARRMVHKQQISLLARRFYLPFFLLLMLTFACRQQTASLLYSNNIRVSLSRRVLSLRYNQRSDCLGHPAHELPTLIITVRKPSKSSNGCRKSTNNMGKRTLQLDKLTEENELNLVIYRCSIISLMAVSRLVEARGKNKVFYSLDETKTLMKQLNEYCSQDIINVCMPFKTPETHTCLWVVCHPRMKYSLSIEYGCNLLTTAKKQIMREKVNRPSGSDAIQKSSSINCSRSGE